MKKVLLILLLIQFTVIAQTLSRRLGVGTGTGGSGSTRFSAIDLDGSSEYMYRSYASTDSFLNMNGYERTVLPQSTMKVNLNYSYNGYDSLNTFSSATDTTAGSLRRWYTGTGGNQGTLLTGGKLRVSVNGNAQGVQFGKTWTSGTLLYVKLKAKFVSLSSGTGAFRLSFTSTVIEEKSFTPTTTEEKTYEFTILSGQNYLQIITYGASTAVIELDDIEVREVTNSVTNGTFADTTKWTTGSGWSISGGVASASATSNSITQWNLSATSGKKYIVTYQISSYTSGTVTVSFGGVNGTARSATGVYSDTITATSTNNLSFTGSSFTGNIDNVHLYEIPSYLATGNHSAGWTKIDALANSSSDTTALKIISTGAGNSSNCVYLVSGLNTFHGFTSGNKYTVELWARGTGIRGTNLVPDSACYFNTSTGGVTWWSAGNGSATWESTDSSLKLSSTSTGYIYRNGIVSSGATYRISFKVRANSYTGSIRVYGGTTTNAKTTGSISSSWQTFVLYVTSDGTTLYIQLLDSHTDNVYFDDIVVQPLTAPTLTFAMQGQTKTSSSISVVPGTFTKLVWNLETGYSTGDTLKIYANQADTVYIDSVNISQAYDYIIEGWLYSEIPTASHIFHKSVNLSSLLGRGIGAFVVGDYFYFDHLSLSSNAGAEVSFNYASYKNQFFYYHIRVDRTDSITTFVNGNVVQNSTTGGAKTGNPNGAYNFNLTNSTYPLKGKFGEFRWIRFNNIGNSNWSASYPLTTYNNYTRGQGFQDNLSGGDKKIVVWYDWTNNSTNGTLLMDLSGNGYNLTGNNVTTDDWIQWKR